MEFSPLKLVVFVVALLLLLLIFFTVFSGNYFFSKDPVLEINRSLGVSENSVGKVADVEGLVFHEQSFSTPLFSGKSRSVDIQCNEPNLCCDFNAKCNKAILWNRGVAQFTKPQAAYVGTRCEFENNFYSCTAYFGKKPAQLNEIETKFDSNFLKYNKELKRYEIFEDENFTINHDLNNIGKIPAYNAESIVTFKQKDSSGNINDVNVQSMVLGNVFNDGNALLKDQLILPPKPGDYSMVIKVKGTHAGSYSDEISIKVFARDKCVSVQCGLPRLLGEKCITDCDCKFCNFGFNCQEKIVEKKAPELELPADIILTKDKSEILGSNQSRFEVDKKYCPGNPGIQIVPPTPDQNAGTDSNNGAGVGNCDALEEMRGLKNSNSCPSFGNTINGDGLLEKKTDLGSGKTLDWGLLQDLSKNGKIKFAMLFDKTIWILNLTNNGIDVQMPAGQTFTDVLGVGSKISTSQTEHYYVPACSFLTTKLKSSSSPSKKAECYKTGPVEQQSLNGKPKDLLSSSCLEGITVNVPPILDCPQRHSGLEGYHDTGKFLTPSTSSYHYTSIGAIEGKGPNGEILCMCYDTCLYPEKFKYVLVDKATRKFAVWASNKFRGKVDLGAMFEDTKPVIYLYPEKTEKVSVKINPKGTMIESIPAYNGGWNVVAEPNGLIDKKFDYLFYETNIPSAQVKEPFEGFVVEFENLEKFFDKILPQTGLNEKETFQFKEWWLSKLKPSKYYLIKLLERKTIDEIEEMQITPKPDTVIRIRFLFYPIESKIETIPPEISAPERKGFTVVEWGGLIETE